jgi:phosphopantothenoylcysteine decarboxylase/phosphopantothenate--cysteine ligase
MLQGKKILLGITGSIAAYKAIFLVRLLVTKGAEVKIIMTPTSKNFVPSLVLATLSKNKVLSELADEDTWANHVMLGRWADVMLIAPLSCNTLAKLVSGICDNLLLASYLSATCPVVVAPAMDEDMWHHPTTKRNIALVESLGQSVISVSNGELASGLYGEGRMAEPEEIVSYIEEKYFRLNRLKGKTALVTAGSTIEAIDPVRFISNHSSGKMGIAVAEALYMHGAEVELVCGNVNSAPTFKGIKVINVSSAEEMFNACISRFPAVDITVMTAAVADYTPLYVSDKKIKKTGENLELQLIKTKDILKHLGAIKNENQLLVGFALETNDEREHALYKLREKNADLIVLNSLKDADAGFGKETNKVTIFDKDMTEYHFDLKPKRLVAEDIVELLIKKINDKA